MSAAARPDDLLRRFSFPPVPESIRRLREERARDDPDPTRLASVIAADVGLAAEVLKVVNSAAFGLSRPVASVPQAVMMLGTGNVISIATSAALRHAMGGSKRLERFWDTAADTALVCGALARRATRLPSDLAYSFGLFHDSGIPLLMSHNENHGEVMQRAERERVPIQTAEIAAFRIDHARLGAHLAESWRMPDLLVEGIRLHHHYRAVMSSGNGELRSLVSVLKFAEHVSNEFRTAAFRGGVRNAEWEHVADVVLGHLGLSEVEYEDLRDEYLELLGSR